MGLTRKGKGTKWMLVVDGRGTPLGGLVASAQKAEVQLAEATLDQVRVPRHGRGRPRKRPQEVVADRGYDSDQLRIRLRRRGVRPCIPERRRSAGARRGRKPRPGRKADTTAYRHRWKVERTFAWLGNFRRLLVRHERVLSVYHGFFVLACVMIVLNQLLQ